MFLNPKLQQVFDEKGYVVIPFLNAEEVQEMTAYYENNNKRVENYDATYAEFSVLNAENETRKKIFEKITSMFLSKAKSVLDNCQPIIANFVCKEPGKGFVPVHQNWAVVDESKYTSVSIWCPLVDTNKANGTLAFVDGSHKFFRGPRGSYANRSFKNVDDLITQNYLTYIDVKAGYAIILDDSVIHYSALNSSGKMRLAIQLIMLPQEAKPYHYTFIEENGNVQADVYEVDPAYYLGMQNWMGDLNNYKKIDSFPFEHKYYSETEFKERMFGKPQGILSRLYSLVTG